MKHRTLTILGLLAVVAIASALARTFAVSITVPKNIRVAIVVSLSSPATFLRRWTPAAPLDASRVTFHVTDLPAGFYAVMEFAQPD
jgi:subtilisin-like proprotein convertase family protein